MTTHYFDLPAEQRHKVLKYIRLVYSVGSTPTATGLAHSHKGIFGNIPGDVLSKIIQHAEIVIKLIDATVMVDDLLDVGGYDKKLNDVLDDIANDIDVRLIELYK